MKTLITTTICIGILVLFSCNRKAVVEKQEPTFSESQYIVTLKDGYTMKDLRSVLGNKVAKIGPSSKSQNVYLLTLTEEMTTNELLEYSIVLDVVSPSKELEAPSQSQSTQKGTSSPIKKN